MGVVGCWFGGCHGEVAGWWLNDWCDGFDGQSGGCGGLSGG